MGGVVVDTGLGNTERLLEAPEPGLPFGGFVVAARDHPLGAGRPAVDVAVREREGVGVDRADRERQVPEVVEQAVVPRSGRPGDDVAGHSPVHTPALEIEAVDRRGHVRVLPPPPCRKPILSTALAGTADLDEAWTMPRTFAGGPATAP